MVQIRTQLKMRKKKTFTAFLARIAGSSKAIAHGQVIEWDEVVFDHGNNFDVISSHGFIAPVDGLYS